MSWLRRAWSWLVYDPADYLLLTSERRWIWIREERSRRYD
jgi:hypothetical protein